MKFVRLAVLACLPWLGACGHSGGSGSGSSSAAMAAGGSTADAASPTASKGFRTRSGDLGDDDSAKLVSRFGSTNPLYDKNGKRRETNTSKEFAGSNHEFQGGKKDFKTDLYNKKSFWGDKEYAKKVYGGDTDGSRFMKDSKLGGKSANEGGMAARDADKAFATRDYATKSAREAGGKNLDRPSDAEADYRRKVSNEFAESPVMGWKEQRQMSIQETRKLLGR